MLNEIEKNLIALIKARMKELGFSVPRLSKETGLSVPGLYKVLDGTRWPGPDNLLRICNKLQISILGVQPEISRPDPFLLKLAEKTADFSAEEKAALLGMIEQVRRLRSAPSPREKEKNAR